MKTELINSTKIVIETTNKKEMFSVLKKLSEVDGARFWDLVLSGLQLANSKDLK